MKRYIIALLLFALLQGAYAAIPQGSAVSASLLRYDPVPAEPGDIIDAYLVVLNSGGSPAEDVVLEFIDNYPFSADNAGDAMKTFPQIPGQESWIAKYKVRINQDATEGTSYIKIRLTMKDSTASKEYLFPVEIKTNDPMIAIKSVEVTPENINPGSTATIRISLENLADSRLKDIAIKLSTQKTVGSTTSVLPIAPLSDSLEKRLINLGPGQETEVTFSLIIEPGATSDVYRIPLTIDYSDENGNDYQRTDEIGIIVNAEADMQVYLETVDVFKDKRQGDITIKFVNRGLSKLKLVTAKLDESEDFSVLTHSRETYIGNIDSDDYETATFTVVAKKDTLNIPLSITYLDAFNEKYEKKVTLTADLLEEKQNGKKSSPIGFIILAVVVVIVALFIYRRIRKKKRRA
jgi:hypothetical protein